MIDLLVNFGGPRHLDEIASFTIENWGVDQAENYVDDLYEICRLIAQHPLIGRPYGSIHPTWRRLEHTSHVVLYSRTRSGITVQRIMHKTRLL